MLGEQGVAVAGYSASNRPEDEYASENTKRFTVDSLLQIRRPDAADRRPDDGGKTRSHTRIAALERSPTVRVEPHRLKRRGKLRAESERARMRRSRSPDRSLFFTVDFAND